MKIQLLASRLGDCDTAASLRQPLNVNFVASTIYRDALIGASRELNNAN
jgi:hypothetical protein